jgi:hypothetical protein
LVGQTPWLKIVFRSSIGMSIISRRKAINFVILQQLVLYRIDARLLSFNSQKFFYFKFEQDEWIQKNINLFISLFKNTTSESFILYDIFPSNFAYRELIINFFFFLRKRPILKEKMEKISVLKRKKNW